MDPKMQYDVQNDEIFGVPPHVLRVHASLGHVTLLIT